MSSECIYYVYAYLREKDSKVAKAGTPYYIGKGKNNRINKKHDNVQLPKDKKNRVIVEGSLTEVGALAIERRLIRWYGRVIIDAGILRNKTEGGDGNSLPGSLNGMFGKTHTAEVRKKLSDANKGRVIPQEQVERTAAKMRGQKRSDEVRKKMSDIQLANGGNGPKSHTPEAKDKMSKALKGRTFSENHKKNKSIATANQWKRLRESGYKRSEQAIEQAMQTRQSRIAAGDITPYSIERNRRMAATKTGKKKLILSCGAAVMV